MIEANDLSIGYDGHPVQNKLTFEVSEGELVAILGGSGCGKTTLLRTLVGLLPPVAGTLSVAGLSDPSDLRGQPPFGVMFQMGALFSSMTLEQNVSLPLEVWTDLDRGTISEIARAKLALVGLDGRGGMAPSEISGGMKKRAAIARAMALDPPLLFLDEPSAGLDPSTSAGLDELILSLRDGLGTTIVLVTHELDSIQHLNARCLMLDAGAGTLIADGLPGELQDGATHPAVRAFFRREMKAKT
jgi:phospholipid/cholesterol/gamma-HCH transport system ATP-binding protein